MRTQQTGPQRNQAICPVPDIAELCADQLQLGSVLPELLALGELEVRASFLGGEAVRKVHRAAAEVAGAVALAQVQPLKLERRGRAVAAAQLALAAQFGAGGELSLAGERRVLLRMDSEGARATEVAFGFAEEEIAG